MTVAHSRLGVRYLSKPLLQNNREKLKYHLNLLLKWRPVGYAQRVIPNQDYDNNRKTKDIRSCRKSVGGFPGLHMASPAKPGPVQRLSLIHI